MNASEESDQQTILGLLDENVPLLMVVCKRCPLDCKELANSMYMLLAEAIREHASELYLRLQSAAGELENEQEEKIFLVALSLMQNQGETMKEQDKSNPKPLEELRDCHMLQLPAFWEIRPHHSNDYARKLNQILSIRRKAPASSLSLQFQSTDREIGTICRNDFILNNLCKDDFTQNIISIQEKTASTIRPKPSLLTPKIQRKHQHADGQRQHYHIRGEHLPDALHHCHQNPDL